jgi:DNA-binding NtrC family response regulator
MPPLRQRRSDIPVIIKHFIKKYGKSLNREVRRIDATAIEVLSRYSWPGNVRELENAILRVMTSITSDTIKAGDLPRQIAQEARKTIRLDNQASIALENGKNGKLNFEQMVKEYSRDLIVYALQKHRGNKTKTAEALGILRGKLKYQIKHLGIE